MANVIKPCLLIYSQNPSLFILKTIMTTVDNLASEEIVLCCHSCLKYKKRTARTILYQKNSIVLSFH